MRIKIVMVPEEGSIGLPFNYYHSLQAIVYNLMDNALAEDVHNSKKTKLITFSNLSGLYLVNPQRKEIIFTNTITWYISCYSKEIGECIINNLTKKKSLILNHHVLNVQYFTSEDTIINSNRIMVETLSPVTVHRSVDIDGATKTLYFEPTSEEFVDLINSNLQTKKSIIGDDTTSSVTINPVGKIKKAIIDYKGFIVAGYQGRFVLEGSSNDLTILNETGLGDRNMQGFGMFKIIE